MKAEFILSEGNDEPLQVPIFSLDLVGKKSSLNRLGIDNTVGGWTPIHERIMRLEDFNPAELSSYLYYVGYAPGEIGKQLGTSRQNINHRIGERAERPPWVEALRRIFRDRIAGMDAAVGILLDFGNGLTPADIENRNPFRSKAFWGKCQQALLTEKFPIPGLPGVPIPEFKSEVLI